MLVVWSLSGIFPQFTSWKTQRLSPHYSGAVGEICCCDYWSALELKTLRKYQSAPPCTSEMEDKHMLQFGWIVVFRVLDTGVLEGPRVSLQWEPYSTVSLLWHLWESRPRQDQTERSCTEKASRRTLTIYRQSCWIHQVGGGLFA